MDPASLIIAFCGIALGGFLKGATGAGAPVVGVPILALAFGVPKAVAIFALLNLFSNAWQAWSYRSHLGGRRFITVFSIGGGLGAAAGTVLLTTLPTDVLMGWVAGIVFLYIALRVARPGWKLARERGETLAGPMGFFAGLAQGAGGISAPVSVTYLSAMRLARTEFIATISAFFLVMSFMQVMTLVSFGVLTWDRAGLAVLATIPMFLFMPVGEWAARYVSQRTFDRLILLLLAVVALRLGYAAIT